MTEPTLTVVEPPPPGKDVVAMFEKLLERAKAGEFSAAAVALVDRDCVSVRRTWTKGNAAVLLGAIDRLQFKFNQQWNPDE